MQERIKAIRKYVKMTQSEFAISLGLGPYSSAAWEKKDAQIPTESMQLLICKTFGINKHWLETGEGDMLDGKSEDEILVEQAIRKAGDSPAIRALLEAWLKLPDNGRVALERFAADFVAGWQAQQDARKEAETAARVRENIQSEESAASNQ